MTVPAATWIPCRSLLPTVFKKIRPKQCALLISAALTTILMLRLGRGLTLFQSSALSSTTATTTTSTFITLIQQSFLLDNVLTYDNYTAPWWLWNNTMYTRARNDRSGAIVHDMLLAHAWLWQQGQRYGGACRRSPNHGMRRETYQLLHELQLHEVLPYAAVPCETLPRGQRMDDQKYKYRKYDSRLMTAAWRTELLREWEATQQQQQRQYQPQQQQQAQKNQTPPHAPEPVSTNNNPDFTIVVHIRRGDVRPCRNANRYLTNDYYQQLIDRYTPSSTATNPPTVSVVIYSEPHSHETFDDFTSRGYQVRLHNVTLGQVWRDLIQADVAILSRSSFSFVPAILNRQTVVYTPFWHRPHRDWTNQRRQQGRIRRSSSNNNSSSNNATTMTNGAVWEIVDNATLFRNELQVQQLQTECCGKDKCPQLPIQTDNNNNNNNNSTNNTATAMDNNHNISSHPPLPLR